MPRSPFSQWSRVSFDSRRDADRILWSQHPEVMALQEQKSALCTQFFDSKLQAQQLAAILDEAPQESLQGADSIAEAKTLFQNFGWYPIHVLHQMQKKYAGQRYMKAHAEAIARYLQLLEAPAPPASMARLSFDPPEWFEINEGVTFRDFFNTQCFSTWNGTKKVSLADVYDDLRTFEYVRYQLDRDAPELPEILQPFLAIAERRLKWARVKKQLETLRDKQHVHLYRSVVDFAARDSQEHNGLFAEQIFERCLRSYIRHEPNLQNLQNQYAISVRKASLAEDQVEKMDFVVTIKHKSLGFSIDKELQFTINQNPEIIDKKQAQLAVVNQSGAHNIDLVALTKNSLGSTFALWRQLGSPVWVVEDLVSFDDAVLLSKVFDKILYEAVQTLETRAQEVLNPDSEPLRPDLETV